MLLRSPHLLQMYHQHGNISRRHTGNSGRLADILRFVEIQFLDCLSSKAVHRRIVEIRRDFSSFQLLELSYLLLLSADISVIFQIYVNLLPHISRKFRSLLVEFRQHLIIQFRSLNEFCECASGF